MTFKVLIADRVWVIVGVVVGVASLGVATG